MKILTKILCGVAVLSSLALIGCGSPEDVLGDTPGSGPEAPGSAAEKKAFSRTFVSGENSWAMTNVSVAYLKRNLSTNKVKARWQTNCGASGFRISGNYPNVILAMGQTACAPEFHPFELSQLELILKELVYKARHSPTNADLDRFRLSLQNADLQVFHFSSYDSSNSLIRYNDANFDFAGIEVDDINGSPRRSTYIVNVAIQGSEHVPSSIKISFNEESSVRSEAIEIQILARLQPN